MSGVLAPSPLFQSFTANGLPNSFGTLATYAAGTSTPQATYTDASLTQPNLNPIQLNPLGQAAVWLNPTLGYKFVWFDQFGNQIGSCDQVYGALTQAALTTILTQAYLGAILYPQTAAELAASVTPVSFAYPEMDVRRYGAATAASAAVNTTAINNARLVAAQYVEAEIYIAESLSLLVNQVAFSTMNAFNLRIDGVVTSAHASLGTAFTNQTSSQGVYTPVNFTGCTQFKVYGKGYINNGFVDAVWLAGCNDFDWSLDLRGQCTNSSTPTGNSQMNGMTIVGCNQFRLHDMTVDSVCSQNMNNSTDVYYSWMNNINVASGCTDFEIGPNVVTRKAGYAGIYVGSNSFDFSIHDNIVEFCSGTACQIAWSGGGAMAQRFTVADNIWRYNQEDAFCVQNGSGTNASIGASVTGNVAIFNGWCNCLQGGTASAGGGAGLNFQGVDDFVISGNSSTEHTTSGLYLYACARVSGNVGSIFQQIAGGSTVIGVCIVGGANDIKLSGGTVHCAGSGTQSFLRSGSCNDVHLSNISFTAGQFSDSASCSNCTNTGIVMTCPSAVGAVCNWVDCAATVTGSSAQGIVAELAGIKLIRCYITAPSNAIVVNALNDCMLEGCFGNSTAGGVGIQIIACPGVSLIGCTGQATTGAGIGVSGTMDRPVLINCKGASTSGNSLLMASSSVTNATLISFRSLSGTTSVSGTTFLTGMNIP